MWFVSQTVLVAVRPISSRNLLGWLLPMLLLSRAGRTPSRSMYLETLCMATLTASESTSSMDGEDRPE